MADRYSFVNQIDCDYRSDYKYDKKNFAHLNDVFIAGLPRC